MSRIVNQIFVPQTVIFVIEDISNFRFLLLKNLNRCQEIREEIVTYVTDNWNDFFALAYNYSSYI